VAASESQQPKEQLRQIESYLGVPEIPEDDLGDLQDMRLPGSCSWLTDRQLFRSWMTAPPALESRVLWIHAKPATGKSVMAGHIVETVLNFSTDCSYYFFRHGHKVQSTVAGCMLSLLYQMAVSDKCVRDKLLAIIENEVRFDRNRPRSIWRKVLCPSVLSTPKTHFWVIDALDECVDIPGFFNTFHGTDAAFPVKICITSRRTEEIAAGFFQMTKTPLMTSVLSTEIQIEDTEESIHLYLESNKYKMHVDTEEDRQLLLTKILEKADGCFLWVRLVLEELSAIWTANQVEQALEDVPQGMDLLYARAVQCIASRPAPSIALAAAILTWSACATRPLSVSELQSALNLDLGSTLHEPRQAIPSLCSQLVYVDRHDRVLMIHLTAKTFLQDRALESPLAICPSQGHGRIARVCLKFLVSDKMEPPPRGRRLRSKTGPAQQSPFQHYASLNFAEHLGKAAPGDTVLCSLLCQMLQENVFTWIEFIASLRSVRTLIRSANLITNCYQRQQDYFMTHKEHANLIKAWTVDFHCLVGRFGAHLVQWPSSIHTVIPPFCPSSSAVSALSQNQHKSIRIVGFEEIEWSNRISCINFGDEWPNVVAARGVYFAVAFGRIVSFYDDSTCQYWKSIYHGTIIRQLGFSSEGSVFVSIGSRDLRVWNLDDLSLRFSFNVNSEILCFSIRGDGSTLTVALQSYATRSWSLASGAELSHIQRRPPSGGRGTSPYLATFSLDEAYLAVACGSESIYIRSLHGGIGPGGLRHRTDADVHLRAGQWPRSLVFNPDENKTLLAVAGIKSLSIFDYGKPGLLESVEWDDISFPILTCSPNGATLAVGNISGGINLYAFDTLHLLSRISTNDNFPMRTLVFSEDDTRLIESSSNECSVWKLGSLSPEWHVANREPRGIGQSGRKQWITALTFGGSTNWLFIGKSDGSVWLYCTRDGSAEKLLYRHSQNRSVKCMAWGEKKNVLVTTTGDSRFILSIWEPGGLGGFNEPSRLQDVECGHFDANEDRCKLDQLLLDEANNRLLLSTRNSHIIWDLGLSEAVALRNFGGYRLAYSANNPVDATEWITVSSNGIVEIWDWEACKKKKTLGKFPQASTKDTRTLIVTGIRQAFASMLLVDCESHIKELRKRVRTHLCVFSTTLLLDPRASGLGQTHSSSKAFAGACKNLLYIIGTFDSRIVFLDKQFCVCSVELISSSNRAGFRCRYHFFIPTDWYEYMAPKAQIMGNGDVLFVKAGEVAVIKHGLTFEQEQWEIWEE